MSRILVLLLGLALAACGTKGALTLPPGQAPEPLLGNPKPAAQSKQEVVSAKADDGSTQKEGNSKSR